MRTAYTSTVVARGHVLAGLGLGLVALLVLRPGEVGLAAAVVLANEVRLPRPHQALGVRQRPGQGLDALGDR